MAGEPLCSGTNNMFITMNTCYVALKVVSPAVAEAAAIYWTEESVATIFLDLLYITCIKTIIFFINYVNYISIKFLPLLIYYMI